jgi:hypothetical protein
MFKMNSHDPFEYLKHKLWLKERSKVKVLIWFPTNKNQELPWITYVQEACHISLKTFDEDYNFALDLISIRGLHKELWASKVVEVPIFKISGLLIWKFRKKCHLDVTSMVNHRKYYKGKGGGFFRVWPIVSFMN